MEFLNSVIHHQFEAAMCTLYQSIKNCTDEEWNRDHFNGPISQVLFHVLIFTDIYLGRNEKDIKNQEFHINNKEMFKDYEELEDRKPINVYTKKEIENYFSFCMTKGKNEIAIETQESFSGESGFSYRKFSRLELYIYLIRHIQHHAAQLGQRIEEKIGKELVWIGSGWKENI